MNALVLQLLVNTMSGWVNRGQQQVIDYLMEENRVLREQLHGCRLRLTDTQRRRLAVRGQVLGRKALAGIACIVTPDTLLTRKGSFAPSERNVYGASFRSARSTSGSS